MTSNLVTLQWLLTVALAFVLGIAGWGVKRFIALVDTLALSVGGLHDRMGAVEVELGLMRDRRAEGTL